MTLSEFIVENVEEILSQWVEFARTLSSGKPLDVEGLRDHAKKMLLAVAAEMATGQTDAQQQAKSRGEAPVIEGAEDTAAETHGDQRYLQGFKLEELVAEFRALRATVIRLWTHTTPVDERTVYELTRFNEGIDQLLAESILHFSAQLNRARQLFLGMLGHDLRTDLQVIFACADRLQRSPSAEQIEKYVPHINQSANHIRMMAEDLLDVVRTQLGRQLPVEGADMDAAALCEEVLLPFQQLHPECKIGLSVEGNVSGEWDRNRIQQMLTNLVRNAFQHGDRTKPITLSVRGDEDSVLFEVHNFGDAIPSSLIAHIFDPLRQGDRQGDRTSLGLGLYIASAIAQAHRGTLSVSSFEAAGTTFSARLPRRASPEP
jgi:signal transduction histidine kinase